MKKLLQIIGAVFSISTLPMLAQANTAYAVEGQVTGYTCQPPASALADQPTEKDGGAHCFVTVQVTGQAPNLIFAISPEVWAPAMLNETVEFMVFNGLIKHVALSKTR